MGRRSSSDTEREPCPDRIIDDAGTSFGMGLIGGSFYHFAKGIRSSPIGHRLAGGVQIARMNAPRTGGSFAAWGGLFSATDCALVYLRQKEDPWNSIFAGANAGAVLAFRQGLGRAAGSALFCGAILALIEGLTIVATKVQPIQSPQILQEDPNMMPSDMAGSPEWMVRSGELETRNSNSDESFFGRWREKLGLKKEEKRSDDSAETKVLESFDGSPTPMPTFEIK